MTSRTRGALAVVALLSIAAITASWWALALWPVPGDAPDWLLRTREVCFGSTADTLPSPTGWALLVGQPIGMTLLLVVVWGADLRAGLRAALSRVSGQVTAGVAAALVVVGVGATVERVRTAGFEPFEAGSIDVARQLTRIDDKAPALALTDQSGREVTLEAFRGRPVIVTFAFAHCETVCPLIVGDVLGARQALGDLDPEVLVVTLDPWRDTPSRLATIAEAWGLGKEARVLSGDPEVVERTLNAWRVPRTRNTKTGDILHPTIVYVIGRDGRIAYVVNGSAGTIAAAVRAL